MINKFKKFVHKRKKLLVIIRFLIYPIRETYSLILMYQSFLKCLSLSNKKYLKLELGSGAKKGTNGWLTLDLVKGADIFWDLKKGIPFKEQSVDILYSSHLLEHMPSNELEEFIKECLRILKKGGSFIVCVPNARNYIEAYMKKENFRKRGNYWLPGKVDTGSRLDELNYIAYMGGLHYYMFDEENLLNILLKCGFKKANLRQFDPSLDLRERDYESIYALGIK